MKGNIVHDRSPVVHGDHLEHSEYSITHILKDAETVL